MACIRKRRKNGEERYVVDWYDALGFRRMKFYARRTDAEAELAEVLRQTQHRTRPLVDPQATVSAYGAHWLEAIAPRLKPRTVDSYRNTLRLHIEPELGQRKVRQLDKGSIKTLLVEKLRDGYARDSVRIVHATIRSMLAEAVEDGLLVANPADGLHRRLRLVASQTTRQESVKAMTEEQLEHFLATAVDVVDQDVAVLFTLLADTGLRIGEALAVQPSDFDWQRLSLRIERALSQGGEVDTPKSGHGRTVDLSRSPRAVTAVQALLRARRAAKVVNLEERRWLFYTAVGTPYAQRNVLRDMKRVLRKAELPRHFGLHSLRHTYAAQRIAAGENVYFVSQQLGHASTKLTLDTYGRWLPARSSLSAPAAPSSTGDQNAANVVTNAAVSAGERV